MLAFQDIHSVLNLPDNQNVPSHELLYHLSLQDTGIILDLGSGSEQHHANYLRQKGKEVVTLDFVHDADINKDYMEYQPKEQYGSIWCSHVLEHQLNPNQFLKKIHRDLKEDGILAITVPPRKDRLVGGHVSLWIPQMVIYHLVMAGFDCSGAKVKAYGYNISVFLRKKTNELPSDLHYDRGDLEKLSHLFPAGARQGMDGRMEVSW